MSTYATVIYGVVDGVGRITLNRPAKLNSFTAQMHGELRETLGRVCEDGARVLVLSGAGRAFCAGQDLGERVVPPGAPRPDLGDSIERHYKPLALALNDLAIPVIAAVNGVAAGAGANLALSCDLVIAAHSATFVQPFCRLGLVPDAGGTWTLPRLAGMARALGMTLLGEPLPAPRAAEWGLIWQCVADEQLPAVTADLAARLARGPTRGLVHIRRALRASWQGGLAEALDRERDAQRELGCSDDYAEGVAAFIAKRTPQFHGR